MPVFSPMYPVEQLRERLPRVEAVGAMAGRLVDDNGGVTGLGTTMMARATATLVWEALAYVDVIHSRLDKLDLTHSMAIQQTLMLQSIAGSLTAIQQKQDAILTALQLVEIPPWANKAEVEEGDDMKLVVLSAESLGLVVEWRILQLEPGFEHEQVVRIQPPAGTLVPRGTTVLVTINLEG